MFSRGISLFRRNPVLGKGNVLAVQKRDSGGLPGGIPGLNLPFHIGMPFSVTVLFTIFFGVPVNATFLVVRYIMYKRRGSG